jgi:hypothetical protein
MGPSFFILAYNLIATGCLVYMARERTDWLVAASLLGVVPLYTIVDVVLRALWGVRVLDIFR